MSNIASALKEEISRLARKELKRETSTLKKSSATHRAEIAALKRRVQELERRLRRAGREDERSVAAAANEDSVSSGARFSAKSMASQRKRLGLSAAEVGRLIGASAQSIYNWEEGKAHPRALHLPAIYALRNLGRRQAGEILETRKAAYERGLGARRRCGQLVQLLNLRSQSESLIQPASLKGTPFAHRARKSKDDDKGSETRKGAGRRRFAGDSRVAGCSARG